MIYTATQKWNRRVVTESIISEEEMKKDMAVQLVNKLIHDMPVEELERLFNINTEASGNFLKLTASIESKVKKDRLEELLSVFKEYRINRKQKFISGSVIQFNNWNEEKKKAFKELQKLDWFYQATMNL